MLYRCRCLQIQAHLWKLFTQVDRLQKYVGKQLTQGDHSLRKLRGSVNPFAEIYCRILIHPVRFRQLPLPHSLKFDHSSILNAYLAISGEISESKSSVTVVFRRRANCKLNSPNVERFIEVDHHLLRRTFSFPIANWIHHTTDEVCAQVRRQ